MVQRLIPGGGYVDETGTGQRLVPGVGYVAESVSGGGGSTYSDSVSESAAATSSQDATITAGGTTYSASATETATVSSSQSATVVGVPTITIPALRDWSTGNLKAGETGITVIINDKTSGALVVKKTGQTTNGSGDCIVSDATMTAGVSYRVTTILADGSEGTWTYTAA